MSLALRLQERQVPCLLVEAGGYAYSELSQDCYRGDVIGDPYHALHEARLRQFGGTSGHWSGWVYPLDAIDFEPRAYMPNSGCPIRSAELQPYSAAADEILQIKPHLNDRPMTPAIDYIHYRFSPPVRLGSVYRRTVEQSPTIGLLLNTPVLELVPGKGRIESIRVSQRQNGTSDIRVDQVCVCTGGIENSRLLLWSNARHAGGVVPHAAALGRYWMEHPVYTLADAVTSRGYEMQYESDTPEKWFFAPSVQAKKMFAIGGAHIWLRRTFRTATPPGNSGTRPCAWPRNGRIACSGALARNTHAAPSSTASSSSSRCRKTGSSSISARMPWAFRGRVCTGRRPTPNARPR